MDARHLPGFCGLVRCVCGGDGSYLLSISQQRSIGRFCKETIKVQINWKTDTTKQKKWLLFATVVLSREQNVTVHKSEPPTGYTIQPDANCLWCCHLPFAHGQHWPQLHKREKKTKLVTCIILFNLLFQEVKKKEKPLTSPAFPSYRQHKRCSIH